MHNIEIITIDELSANLPFHNRKQSRAANLIDFHSGSSFRKNIKFFELEFWLTKILSLLFDLIARFLSILAVFLQKFATS